MVFRRFNLDDGQIRFPVNANHLGIVQHSRSIILQLYANAVSAVHNVEVSHDVAIRIHDNAGAQRALTSLGPARPAFIRPLSAKKAVKKVLEWVLSFFVRIVGVIGIIGIAAVWTAQAAPGRLGG